MSLKKKKTHHFGHFILTCFTGGLWIVPWLVIYAINQNHNSRIDQTLAMMDLHNQPRRYRR